MAKTPADVLNEWVLRGYITAEQSTTDAAKYTSYINQAKGSILSYCNLPLNIQNFPDGLFYPWVEIAWATANGATFIEGSGAVKSVTEGDTTIAFDVGTTAVSGTKASVDYSSILNRYRRMP